MLSVAKVDQINFVFVSHSPLPPCPLSPLVNPSTSPHGCLDTRLAGGLLEVVVFAASGLVEVEVVGVFKVMVGDDVLPRLDVEEADL